MVRRKKAHKSTAKDEPAWKHYSRINDTRLYLKCNNCGLQRWGGITRMKHHFVGDHDNVRTQCPEDVRVVFIQALQNEVEQTPNYEGSQECFKETDRRRGTPTKQRTMNEMIKKREPVIHDICRFFYGHALAFNIVKSPLFAKMMKSVDEYSRGLNLPSYHEC
ncbi:hypothetical protein Droror1_Dr00023773 [Drosera rotundifolia]